MAGDTLGRSGSGQPKVQSGDEYEPPRDEQDAVPFDDPLRFLICPSILKLTGRIQGGRFVPGVSGNPAGKPPGARARATRLAEKLMAGDAEPVVRAVIEAAKGGDMTAARLVLDRIAPPCRGRRVRLALPPIVSAADLVGALAAVADAMARGVLSAEEAQSAATVLEHHRKAVETLDLERRIAAIENMQKLNER